MSISPAIAGCQFELNRPLSDSAQRLSASANSVRDKQDPFRAIIKPPTMPGVMIITKKTREMNEDSFIFYSLIQKLSREKYSAE
jgi:hypothetical protein